MKLTWLGHSCFTLEEDGYLLVLDPYTAGSVPGLRPVAIKAHQVLCSHEHGDHNGRGEVTLLTERLCPFEIKSLLTYHDEAKGAKRGTNQIFLIRGGGVTVAHLGDLGCEPTPEQREALKEADVLLVPVGGFYTIDAAQAAVLVKELNPRIVIPMHYRDAAAGFGYDVIGTVEEFTRRMEKTAVLSESSIDLEKEQKAQVVVLTPARGKK